MLELFARRDTSLAGATEGALARERGGRPALGDLLPIPDRLTPRHVRHARQVFGYTADEIALHDGRNARTLLRWAAA